MKVIGIGDNVVDMYMDQKKMYLGGNALNFAVFSSKLGIKSSFIGLFGSDKIADYAKETLKELNVDISHSRTINGENGYSQVTLKDGDRVFITSNRGGVLKKGLNLCKDDLEYINTFDIAHFNINGNANEYLSKILSPKVVYDFSDQFKNSDVRNIASKVDLACFSGDGKTEDEMITLMKYAYRLGTETVLVTKGSDGAWVYDKNGLFHQPAIKTDATDTMGAGDSFITAFSTTLYSNNNKDSVSIENALNKAAHFAAKQVKTNGSFEHGRHFAHDYNVI